MTLAGTGNARQSGVMKLGQIGLFRLSTASPSRKLVKMKRNDLRSPRDAVKSIPNCSTCPDFERDACFYPNRYFHCPGCGKDVPWCFGCALGDGMDDLCDACWYQVIKLRREARIINDFIDVPLR